MSISLPNLDDRRWADLVDEGRALLPVYARGWTDHNVSDPGITLIELFASLAEQDIYRLNRITARNRTKFLELIDGLPRPPQAARSVLALRLHDPNAQRAAPVPAGCEFELSPGGLVFRTLHPLKVGGAVLRALQVSDGTSFRVLDLAVAEDFFPFGDDPQPGAALYLGFDRALLAGERTSLYVAIGAPGESDNVRSELVAALCAAREACFEDDTSGHHHESEEQFGATDRPGAALQAHHSAQLTWEYRDAAGRWLPLGAIDGSRAFTLEGHVWLDVPAAASISQARLGSVTEPLWYLRVRLTAGQFDRAPHVRSVLYNAVEAEQARAWHGATPDEGVAIGVGTGEPHQRLRLPAAPALIASLHVWTLAPDGSSKAWHPRVDLAASSAADRHFLFDPTSGELRFGDGRNGRCPEPKHECFVTFCSTAAERGLVRSPSNLQLADSAHNHFLQVSDLADKIEASMPVDAVGGAAAETLGQAIERAAQTREAPLRAVTLNDYEQLALATPGTQLARVQAIANHHPAFECIKAPGLITMIVVPSLPKRSPHPSPGLRNAVYSRLRRRRVLGTRVEVVGPTYLEVAVQARVRLLKSQRPERVQRAIVNALDTFLDPLRGGPDSRGWPFGRDVYRAEILQAIDEVPGVDHVLDLQLLPAGCAPVCGNVCLKPTWLTTPGAHRIEVI